MRLPESNGDHEHGPAFLSEDFCRDASKSIGLEMDSLEWVYGLGCSVVEFSALKLARNSPPPPPFPEMSSA